MAKSDAERKREYRAHKKAQREHWKENFEPIPDYIKKFMRQSEPNIELEDPRKWFEKAPAHVLEATADGWVLNPDSISKISAASRASKSDEKSQRKYELKNRYPNLWGKRGGARKIASRQYKRGDSISVRTIQRYFKEDNN